MSSSFLLTKTNNMGGETNLKVLISSMKPRLNDGEFVFCSFTTGQIDLSETVFFFKEKEGTTMVFPKKYVDKMGYKYASVYSWITLEVHSSLEAVGLTAAFSQALAAHNISCNVVAGYYHDHIFVPKEKGKLALEALKKLAKNEH
jgi:uncharacterized protein